MNYSIMGLARAILAIKRDFEKEGKRLTIENVYATLITGLPGDVTLTEFRRAIFAAQGLKEAQDEQRRRSRR
jgi:hypothetical protein